MQINISLSDLEWTLIKELLQREQKQLLIEVRHTDSANYRDMLRTRLTAAESALKRFESAIVVEHA